MQNIIQNIETFSFPLVAGQKRFSFPKNFNLKDRKINRIHVFSNVYFDSLDNNNTVAPNYVLGYMLLSLSNTAGEKIITNLPAPLLGELSTMQLMIDDVVDFENSHISINAPSEPAAYNLLVAFEYETTERMPVWDWKNVTRITIPMAESTPTSRYRLSDYKVSELVGKRISKIVCGNNRKAQLFLYCTDGRTVMVPFSFLSDEIIFTVPGKAILFENLQIDFEKSFIETKDNYQKIEMTFYYE